MLLFFHGHHLGILKQSLILHLNHHTLGFKALQLQDRKRKILLTNNDHSYIGIRKWLGEKEVRFKRLELRPNNSRKSEGKSDDERE